ncbi:MAG TPA: RnfABCDGE type electron transport complex subunit D [Candidatus Cryptobacteroides pullicola]|nr:RnfABCDGE type electron transport complex subunit D [Candidatus Cryptobacteroides pullicola]
MDKYLVSPAPHLHVKTSTQSIMRDVLIALAPAVIVSIVFYGWRELMVLAVSVASCVLTEWAVTRFMLKKPSTVSDLSAAVTGVLLAMNLPASIPWWVTVIGGVFSIGVIKMTFGGLGQNVFNPAIAGRIFLLISFPVYMTDWSLTDGLVPAVDAVSGATPLTALKEALISGSTVTEFFAESGLTLKQMLMDVGASAGEISSIALLVGFAYLLVRKVVKIWIPLSIFATVIVVSGIFSLVNPDLYTGPLFNIFTGGMVLGACFMATDYVTSPMSTVGGIIYGIGIGVIVMMIRYFGSYPEGMSFAILIMNCVVPLLNKWFHSKKYGRA